MAQLVRLSTLLIIVSACRTVPTVESLSVATRAGPVVGLWKNGLRVFLGIPYAEPPTGALRWKAPAAVAHWVKPRDATRFGPSCPQPESPGMHHATAEDCLTLNVWAPDDAARAPVLVWIHGGGFFSGSSSDFLYDGARLAAQTHTVVVSLNYRVGVLGFLAHRELGTASVGLLDQQAALRWVQQNIGAFGGDPANVTVFGQSAGAWSICSQLAMPGSRGLFAKAILMSGACSDALYFTNEAALVQGDLLAKAVGCGDAKCLRERSADQLINALPMKRSMLLPPGVWWGPVVDGSALPEVPLAAMRAGRASQVPLIYGWARDEGVIHTLRLDDVTPEEVSGFITDHFGARAGAEMPARYPGPGKSAMNDVVTDGVFACATRRVANLLSAREVPVFVYELTHALDDEGPHGLGATHSVDLFFVFGNEDRVELSEREQRMSKAVMTAWGAFARDGHPGPGWPRWTPNDQRYLTLDLQPEVRSKPRPQCDAWDAVER